MMSALINAASAAGSGGGGGGGDDTKEDNDEVVDPMVENLIEAYVYSARALGGLAAAALFVATSTETTCVPDFSEFLQDDFELKASTPSLYHLVGGNGTQVMCPSGDSRGLLGECGSQKLTCFWVPEVFYGWTSLLLIVVSSISLYCVRVTRNVMDRSKMGRDALIKRLRGTDASQYVSEKANAMSKTFDDPRRIRTRDLVQTMVGKQSGIQALLVPIVLGLACVGIYFAQWVTPFSSVTCDDLPIITKEGVFATGFFEYYCDVPRIDQPLTTNCLYRCSVGSNAASWTSGLVIVSSIVNVLLVALVMALLCGGKCRGRRWDVFRAMYRSLPHQRNGATQDMIDWILAGEEGEEVPDLGGISDYFLVETAEKMVRELHAMSDHFTRIASPKLHVVHGPAPPPDSDSLWPPVPLAQVQFRLASHLLQMIAVVLDQLPQAMDAVHSDPASLVIDDRLIDELMMKMYPHDEDAATNGSVLAMLTQWLRGVEDVSVLSRLHRHTIADVILRLFTFDFMQRHVRTEEHRRDEQAAVTAPGQREVVGNVGVFEDAPLVPPRRFTLYRHRQRDMLLHYAPLTQIPEQVLALDSELTHWSCDSEQRCDVLAERNQLSRRVQELEWTVQQLNQQVAQVQSQLDLATRQRDAYKVRVAEFEYNQDLQRRGLDVIELGPLIVPSVEDDLAANIGTGDGVGLGLGDKAVAADQDIGGGDGGASGDQAVGGGDSGASGDQAVGGGDGGASDDQAVDGDNQQQESSSKEHEHAAAEPPSGSAAGPAHDDHDGEATRDDAGDDDGRSGDDDDGDGDGDDKDTTANLILVPSKGALDKARTLDSDGETES